ncbi:U3 small nucleolar RNA-associated protein 10 [Phyllosticta capitalensis]|uniref:U3 small nucleolar RNA-associated protein 10 n=1 Tax=Phyllosticta capitalensis TaxID=121624 RepID=UPI003131A43A
MSSSLQQQLAAIAATSTHQLDIKAQKAAHGKSLLFEPKIAASQDFNTIYQICHEGFQELCNLDPRFKSFAQNLFSEQSKTEDRTQMTKAENEELDNVIESFLGLAGAWLLLKPAIKAVEWLVRRFKIHEYNTEFAILTFLRYHTEPIFLALLSIVPRKISPTYRFLYPYMTSYQNPPFQTIVYTATHTPAFFSALNQYVLKVTKSQNQAPGLLRFWASVATQAVNAQLDGTKSGRGNIQRQREEDFLLRILPVLNEALSLRNAPELKTGCYMIMTVLASKASLEDKVLNGMMEAIVSSWSQETLDDALLSLAILAQERQGAKLPKAVARGLLKLDRLADKFLAVSQQCRSDRLAFGIVLSIIEKFGKSASSDTKAWLEVVETTLQAQVYDSSQMSIIIKSLLLTIHRVDQAADVTIEQRDQLADLIIRLHQSETIGKAVTKVIEDEGMDVEDLEMRLKIVLRPAIEPAKQETEDVDMEDSLPALPDASEDVISSLPTRSTEQSLLATHDSKLFATLSEAFLGCVSSEEKLKKFSQVPLLTDNDTLFLTFLARFWCESHPALARSAALRLATEYLSGLRDGTSDFQGLIPYILNALSDKSAGVRKAAAGLAATVSSKTAQKGTKTSIWAREIIYGSSSNSIKWLSAEDASKVLSTAVVPMLEECILDGNHIKQVLQSAVDDHAHKHAGSTAHGPEFKSALRTGVCGFLSSHAVNTPLLRVRLGLLSFLDGVGKSASAARVQIVLPAVEKWLSLPQSEASSICKLESLDLLEVDRSHLRAIGSRDAEGVQLLQKIIGGQFGSDRSNVQQAAFERLRTIWPSLKANIKEEAAQSLLDLALDPSETDAAQSKRENALETLRAVDLPTQALVSFLDSVPTAVRLPENPPPSKRRRTSKAEMARFDARDTEDTAKAIEKLTLVLELVEGSSPEEHPELLRGLFQILGELQQYKIQTQSSLVYLQSLIITSLLAIVDKLKVTSETIDQSAIRADLLVDCVRQNANPQVQNSALLLISSLATSVPDTVLHSVMPIFTFMSSSTLRQTDEYSAHVIDQTISRVIPPLAASLRKRKRDLVLGAAELLLSFTAAYEHIPLHRRLGLFGQLTKTMGPDDSLFAIVAMLLERYPTDKAVKRFTVDLMRLFDPATNLRASKRYLDLVEDALQPKRTISDALFSLSEKDPDQIQKAAVHLFESLADLLRDVQLHNRVLKSLKDNNETASAIRSVFTQLLERIIELSLSFKDQGVLRDACGRVLSSLLRLLPTPELVKSADNLLGHSNVEVRRTALRAVEAQAIEVKQSNVAARTALLEFLPRITSVITDSDDSNLKHTAVACVDQISEKFGKKDTSAVALAAEAVAGEHALGSKEDRLRVMSLLCLTSIVEILRDDFIPLIPKVLPKGFAYLEESITADSKSSLHNAVYALLCAIIEHIPFMFSGSHLDSALQLSHKSAVAELNDEANENRQQFYLLVAQQVDAKEVFGAAERNLESAVQAGYPAPKEHLAALHKAIEIRPKSVVVKNAQQVFGFLVKAFDLRRTKLMSSEVSDDETEELVEEVAEIEQQINAVAITTVMKLNDATFRPFFVRLVEWASSGLPKKEVRGRMLRATSLFVFLDTFFDKLKSIVTGYSSYMLDLAAEVLGKTSDKSAEYVHLLESTLSALSKSFENDEDDFWTAPAHFSVVSSPLLALIPAFASHPIAESHIIPSLTGLAAAANSPDHHKTLNSAILKFMRHDSASTRLAAIKTEQALTEALGEEWLGLLPEMLPFISELQEDDDEQVERETARWIKEIEEVLGESLEGMLQ